jgi:uncharacterized membrane protein
VTSAPAPDTAAPPARPPRILVVDWLRGIAVVTMVLAHSFDAWMNPIQRTGLAWHIVKHASGIPSRLFLFLVGVSTAIVFESALKRGRPESEMRAQTAKRGLLVLVLAYVFRLQEHILAGFWGGWKQVFRVDILNCIGASLLVLALVGVPRKGRPAYLPALLATAVFVGLGPIVGPMPIAQWFPEPLRTYVEPITSYVGGQRPMSWFALFPWGAWANVGLVIGHLWLRHGRDAAGQARCFRLSGLIGALCVTSVLIVREVNPQIIRYATDVNQQMGPGSFFFRLGLVLLISYVGWEVTRRDRGGFSPVRQLGMTSLLIYWIHVEICYGFATRPLHKQLSFGGATLAYVALLLAMLALSMVKTRYAPGLKARFRARFHP